MPVPLTDLAHLDAPERARLAALVANQATLGDVLHWGLAQKPVLQPEEIITQDEYTHDVVVPLKPPLYLAYDVS
ncbi:MAG TPA: hypothetical protein VH113_09580 [Gemmatimonadales bacterium]|jgi:hypothetical protein|nr:hypothetical protein [Gemmatimonadales bacterium]